MKSLTHFETTPPPCCSPSQAASWLDTLTEMALVYHDDDARRALPEAVDHFLDALLCKNRLPT